MLRHLLIWIILGVFSLVHTGCGSSEAQDDLRKYNSFNPSSDFVLKDQDGRDFHLKDHRGKTVILFFGYLSCPDICPTTLSKLARVYKLLGTDQEKVLTVFVTVDPERDSPSKLKEYLEYFSIKAVGLTGTKAEVDEVAEAPQFVAGRVEVDLAEQPVELGGAALNVADEPAHPGSVGRCGRGPAERPSHGPTRWSGRWPGNPPGRGSG